ncbi:MAG: sugar nucleotide-binding protein [Parcubacteria group bacterium]|nr:sugar nucleotide-binding protein [Parcubacteria group bacterium]
MMKILMTGGSGLLGREILKLDSVIIAPTHGEMDIKDFDSIVAILKKYNPEVVLHLAAYNKPPEHEKNPEPGIKVNIIGAANLALACFKAGIKLIHASTDFVYGGGSGMHKEEEPLLGPSRFGWSKIGAEAAVRMIHNYLILRLDFGPVPFPWDKVYEGQHNSKLYVDEMAPLVLAAAKSSAVGVMNLGGPRTTLENYAQRTKPDIETIPKPDWVPADTSLNITRMKKELGIDDEYKLLKY